MFIANIVHIRSFLNDDKSSQENKNIALYEKMINDILFKIFYNFSDINDG